MAEMGLGRVKTQIDLVVGSCRRRIFAFACTARDHRPQNYRCADTARRFHTARVNLRPRPPASHVSFHQLRTSSPLALSGYVPRGDICGAAKRFAQMRDGSPFGIASLWENWKDPSSGEWIRTFAIITTDSNELVAEIHNRIPVILPASAYVRWLAEEEDPRELMRPFPSDDADVAHFDARQQARER
jgi:putative SOS response-associated peptidase YedK